MESEGEKEITNWRWGYVILLSKFMVMILSSGIAKSFGVLIPEMVDRLQGSYASIGLVCSLPGSFMMFSSPLISFVLARFNHRLVAMIGGLICGISFGACAFVSNVPSLGVCLALSGIGRGCVYYALTLLLERYFPNKFVLMNTLSLYGLIIGVTTLPVITERSLEAYGYSGALLILGAITLNTVACAAAIRKPIFREIGRTESEDHQDETLQIEETEGKGDKDEMVEVAEVITETKIPDAYKEKTQSQVTNGSRKGTTSDADRDPSIMSDKGCTGNNSWTKCGEGNENRSWPNEEQRLLSIDDNETDDAAASETDQVQSPRDGTTSLMSTLGLCANSSILTERLYLLSLPAIFCNSYALNSWILFLVPHAEQLGIAQSEAVFLSSIGGLGGIVGRTISVILLFKRVDMVSVYIVVGVVCSAMFFLDGFGQTFLIRAAPAFVQGLCFYIQDSTTMAMLKVTLLHECNFSLALSLNCCVFGIGLISAGLVTGALFDAIHSYTKTFYVIGCVEVFFIANVTLIKILSKKEA